MRIHLGGHLSWYDRERRSWIEQAQATPVSLREVAEQLGVPVCEIALVAVNGRLAALDELAQDGDRVEYFPPMGGGRL